MCSTPAETPIFMFKAGASLFVHRKQPFERQPVRLGGRHVQSLQHDIEGESSSIFVFVQNPFTNSSLHMFVLSAGG